MANTRATIRIQPGKNPGIPDHNRLKDIVINKQTALSIVLLLISSSLGALVQLGEGSIDLVLDLSTYYDSEINARNQGADDLIFTAAPALLYSRENRSFKIDAAAGIRLIKYADTDRLDNENLFFNLSVTPGTRMKASRFVVSGDLILRNDTRTDESVGEIVTVLTYGASAKVTYYPNSKYRISGEASYIREDPDSVRFIKKDVFSSSLILELPIKKDTYGRVGVSSRLTESDTYVTGLETYTYFAGFQGNLLPKVSGHMDVGLQQQRLDSTNNKGQYLYAGLQWIANERTNVALDAMKGLGTTIENRISDSFSIKLTGRHKLTRVWSAIAFTGYIRDDYSGVTVSNNRTDRETFIGGGTTYRFAKLGSVTLDFRYSDQISSDKTFEYDRLRVGINFRGQW